ncbi:MAG TPA: sulfate permease [Bacteroidia bacterium]|jgi:SulP family sulfate permease|nr:sulfate permease [Bacteroidia bacterium]
MFIPKLFVTLKNYNRKQFASDLVAGIVVGIVALPLAIAFAIASGVSPEKGLYTAIVAGFIISALGGSRVQIGGPTGAFIVIVYGIVQKYGIDGLTIATIMAGVMLLGMGFVRLGSVIKFIPYPLIVGFTSGIALIIFSSEIKDFMGIQMGAVPADFLAKWAEYFKHLDFINYYSIGISAATIFITIGFSKITRHIPGSLIAILLATAAVYFFKMPVETIGSRFGAIPSSLPSPHIPNFDFATIKHLVQPAFTIALLGAIESLLSAVVADGMIGGNHKSNMELVAQGVANIVSPIFGGIPATGAIARTATNVKNGGRTPIAGIIHALTLLLIMVLIGKWATLIPLSCLAGILVVVAYNMSEWRSFVSILKSSRSDAAVLLSTFLLTVLIDLTVAIEVGMVLAAFLFMRRMTQISNVGIMTKELNDTGEGDDPKAINKYKIPKGVEVFEINGPFFFGAAYKFKDSMRFVETSPKVLIIRMRFVPVIDATGLHTLELVFKEAEKRGTHFVISGIQPEVYEEFEKSGLLEKLGKENVLTNIDDALKRAEEILKEQ